MGIAERRLREKSKRRNTILRAAKRIISKHGVEGMSMNQLAEATELNKATLYLYFRDKEDLVDAIVHEGLTILEKTYGKATRSPFSGLKQVLRLVEMTFGFYRQYPVYFYTMNHQERRRQIERLETPYAAKGNEVASRIFEQMAEGVRQGIDDGSIRSEINIDIFLTLLYAQMYGVMHVIYSKEDIYKDVFGVDAATIEKSALETIEYYLMSGKRDGKEEKVS